MSSFLAAPDDLPMWKLSVLTDDGYPFEFTFTTANDGIRYTVEIAPPRNTPAARLDQVEAMLQQLGVPLGNEDTLPFLKQVQASGDIEYGAWMGVRHKRGRTAYKIYAEVPPQGRHLAETFLNQHLTRPVFVKDRPISLRMIGFYPATGEMEFYFHVFDLRPWEIIALMDPVGLGAHHQAVFDLFQKAYGKAMFRRLPAPVFGFSYALHPDVPDYPGTFSLYTFVEAMFGNGAKSRHKLLRFFEDYHLPMYGYAEMSEPTMQQTGEWNHHGLFGVAVAEGMPPVVHVGLRPPETEQAVGACEARKMKVANHA